MIKGFLKYNVTGFLIAEPVILVVGVLVAVTRGTVSAAMFPLRVLAVIYTDVERALWPAAEWSVRAQLAYLADREA